MNKNKKNIAILASGKGSNFEAIVNSVKNGYIRNVEIKLLLSDKKYAPVRKKAKQKKIKDIFINPTHFRSRHEFDKAIAKVLLDEKIDLILLAGYMRILSPYLVGMFKNKILNIHPALLPAFKGKNSIQRALKYGCKVTGVTVHLIDEKVDNGPIILQKSIDIKEGATIKEVENEIHKLEHKLYPLALKLFIDKKIRVRKHHVQII